MSLFGRDHERALRASESGRITTKTGEAGLAGRQKPLKVGQTPHFIWPDGSVNEVRRVCVELGIFGRLTPGGVPTNEARGPSMAGAAAASDQG